MNTKILASPIILKISLISAYILLILGCLSSWNSPATGFEISIYQSTPTIFWMSLILGYIVSITIILIQHKTTIPNLITKAGYLLLFFCTTALSALFIIRGYLIMNMNGDSETHLGNINSMIESGAITSLYPGDYILTVVTSLITEISTIELMNLHSLIFVGIFIIGMYLLSREVFYQKYEHDICLIVTCFFTIGSSYYMTGGFSLSMYIPYISLFLMTPLILSLILKVMSPEKRDTGIFVAVTILCVASVFYHILGSIILVGFLWVAFSLMVLWRVIKRKEYQKILSSNVLRTGFLGLITTFFIALWGSAKAGLEGKIDKVMSLFDKTESPVITPAPGVSVTPTTPDVPGTTLPEITPTIPTEPITVSPNTIETGTEFVDGVLNSYVIPVLLGQYSLFDVLKNSTLLLGLLEISALCILLSIGLYVFKKVRVKQSVVPLFVFLAVVSAVFLLGIVVSLSYQPSRIIVYVSLIGIIAITLVLSYLYTKFKSGKNILLRGTSLTLIIVLGFGICSLGVFSYYPGVDTLSSSAQSSESMFSGMDVYLSTMNIEYETIGSGFVPYRYLHALNSTSTLTQNEKTKYFGEYPENPPDHFNYGYYPYLGNSFVENTYYGYSKYSEEMRIAVHEIANTPNEREVITERDVNRLNMGDKSVSKMFDSTAYSMYIVCTTSGKAA